MRDPSRGFLLYGDRRKPDALKAMKAITAQLVAEAQRPLSKAVLHWTSKGWLTK